MITSTHDEAGPSTTVPPGRSRWVHHRLHRLAVHGHTARVRADQGPGPRPTGHASRAGDGRASESWASRHVRAALLRPAVLREPAAPTVGQPGREPGRRPSEATHPERGAPVQRSLHERAGASHPGATPTRGDAQGPGRRARHVRRDDEQHHLGPSLPQRIIDADVITDDDTENTDDITIE